MPYDPDGTWREPHFETTKERAARNAYEAEVTDDHLDAMSGAEVGLGVQAAQVYKSLSDAAKEWSDQPEPQRQGVQHDDSRAREDAATISKLKAELEKQNAKARERGGMER